MIHLTIAPLQRLRFAPTPGYRQARVSASTPIVVRPSVDRQASQARRSPGPGSGTSVRHRHDGREPHVEALEQLEVGEIPDRPAPYRVPTRDGWLETRGQPKRGRAGDRYRVEGASFDAALPAHATLPAARDRHRTGSGRSASRAPRNSLADQALGLDLSCSTLRGPHDRCAAFSWSIMLGSFSGLSPLASGSSRVGSSPYPMACWACPCGRTS